MTYDRLNHSNVTYGRARRRDAAGYNGQCALSQLLSRADPLLLLVRRRRRRGRTGAPSWPATHVMSVTAALAEGGALARLVRGDFRAAARDAALHARLVGRRRVGRAELDALRQLAARARRGGRRRRGRWRGRGRRLRRVGGVELAVLDVRVEHVRVGVLLLELRGVARRLRAAAAARTLLALRHGVRVDGVEPRHADLVVVPQAHGEHHAAAHRVAHRLERALLREVVEVAEVGLLRLAHAVGDRVVLLAVRAACVRVGDHLAVLHVQPAHLDEVARGCVVARVELRDDGERLRRVELEVGARAEEGLVAHAERVEVAAVLVAHALEALALAVVAAVLALAARLPLDGAAVHGHLRAHDVRLPDVELRAAGTVAADAGVRVRLRRVPVEQVGLA